MVFNTLEIVRPDQHAGDVLAQQRCRDWYNGAANLAAARIRLSRICLYQNHFALLDQDIDNYRSSRSWLANRDGDEEGYLLLDYIDLLGTYLFQRNFYSELVEWCEDGLHVCLRLQRNPAALYFLKGKTLNALGRWQEALDCYHVAIEASSETDPQTQAHATLALGRLQFNQGEYAIALKTLDHAEKLLLELSDHEHVAAVYSERAAYYMNRKDLDRALSLYMQTQHMRQQSGGTSTSDLLMLGVIFRKKKDYTQAINYLQQLLTYGETHQELSTIATASHHLAWIAFDRGKLYEARLLCGKAKTLYEEIQDRRGISDVYEQLGCIELAEGYAAEAISSLKQSLAIRKEIHNQQGFASSLSRLAFAYCKLLHLPAAIWYLSQCLFAYQSIGMLSRQRLFVILRSFLCYLWR